MSDSYKEYRIEQEVAAAERRKLKEEADRRRRDFPCQNQNDNAPQEPRLPDAEDTHDDVSALLHHREPGSCQLQTFVITQLRYISLSDGAIAMYIEMNDGTPYNLYYKNRLDCTNAYFDLTKRMELLHRR